MRRIVLLAFLALGSSAVVASQSYRDPDAPPPAVIGFAATAAISGGTIFVGRSGLVPGFPFPPDQSGAVHVFTRGRDGAWTETTTVAPADGAVGDGFGSTLAVSGTLLAVGAPTVAEERGAVYVFERDRQGTWAQRAKLVAADAAARDRLGAALALAGDVLLAGAPGRDSARGLVVVFGRGRDGAWTEQGRLTAAAGLAGDRFGVALALAGDRALVGAPGPQGVNPAQLRAGQAIAFQRSGGVWREEIRLEARGDTTARGCGAAVLLEAAGAFVSCPGTERGVGAVLQFSRRGDMWQQVARAAPADSTRGMFGMALARAGGDLLVGAPGGAGALHVLRAEKGAWRVVQKESVHVTGPAGQFGASIAVEGDVAIVGGPGADFFEGVGYLFTRSGGAWRAAGTLADRTAGMLAAVTGGEVRCDASGKAGAFECREADLASFLPLSALGGRRGIMLNDIWGWTDPATGREFALVGRMDGTAFVEVTDPARPVYLGELPLHEGARKNIWRGIKVYTNHAFIVADGAGPHGMQVFDLTQLLDVTSPPVTFRETAHYDRIHSAHTIAIDTASGFAYPTGNSMGGETCGGGLHMIDIRDPRQPTFAGCWADTTTGIRRTGYTHETQCVVYHGPDEQYRGHQICFNASETAVGIADVTDKQTPKRISIVTYPNVAYAHQGWLSEDHRYFFLNDEGDELAGTAKTTRTLVFDVSDLDDPLVAKEFFGTTPATDHNLYVRGRYMYQSNYVAGLRVIDVGDPTNPVEVGYFDTVPFGPDRAGFAGTWSNYPFFKSGVVAVTSMREGLFMVRFRPTAPVP